MSQTVPEQRFTFDAVADAYARIRPGYPAALIDALVEGAGLRPGARLLEIGSGPGTATAPLVERGYALVCVEPGEHLAALARARFADAPVQVHVTTFEDFEPEPGAFDLVFAAQSFHWVDPTVRCVKAHSALRAGGTLAIFANRPEHADTPLDDAIQAVYAREAPGLLKPKRGVMTNTSENFRAILDASGLFGAVTCREYPWTASYSTGEYRDLLGTHSDHRMLPDAQRLRLYDGIAAAIEAAGGRYDVPNVAVLAHAAAKA